MSLHRDWIYQINILYINFLTKPYLYLTEYYQLDENMTLVFVCNIILPLCDDVIILLRLY